MRTYLDPTAYPFPIGPRAPRRRRKPTPCCDRIIPRDAARALSRFNPERVGGFRAVDTQAAPIRPTREEAEQDWHLARCAETTTEETR